MKIGIGSASISWIFSYLVYNENVPIPEDIKWVRDFAPLIAVALGHGILGHRIAKRKKRSR